MKKKYIVLFAAGAVIFFMLGFLLSRAIYIEQERTVTFYANVLETNETSLLAEGIPENDVNHRRQFSISMNSKSRILDKSGAAISLGDIPIGSLIMVEYDGYVLETYPEQISDVILIQITE